MAKDNLRLISARIDEESFRRIEEITKTFSYIRRNYVIRKILFAVLSDFNDVDIFNMLRRPYNNVLPAKGKYCYPCVEDDSKE